MYLVAKPVEAQFAGALSNDPSMGIGATEVSGTAIWSVLAIASTGACAYHGYKRNNSVGWGVVWGLLGGLFPVITPAIAIAQGYGKRA